MTADFPLRQLPPDNCIDVWKIDLETPLKPEFRWESILSVEERSRADRFVFAKDAARFRFCRAMLRLGIAWYLQRSPREVTLTTRWRGKPSLEAGSHLYFNVTHSAGMALIAFTTLGEVGIDIEPLRPDVEALEMALAYFTPHETALVAASSSPLEQARKFLRIWTRKEAILKAAGCGILSGLDTFDVSHDVANEVRFSGDSGEIAGTSWLVRDLDDIEGFSASVAAPPGEWTMRQWSICDQESIERLIANHAQTIYSSPENLDE